MIDLQISLRTLPTAVLVICLLAKGMCHIPHSKTIILEDEEDVMVSVELGDSLIVKCEYSEDFRIIDFEWKKIKNNRWNVESPSVILNGSQWLYFDKTNFFDEGKYSCSINGFNENGTFSKKRGFALNVWEDFGYPFKKNEFSRNSMPNYVPLLLNDTLRLSCPFTSTIDTVFSWYKNDKLLVERKAIIGIFGFIDNEYSSKQVRLSDAGNYTCVARSTIASFQHTFTVVVYEDRNKMPRSFEYPLDLSLKSGDTAQFYCNAFHYCRNKCLNLKWYFWSCANPRDIDIETVDLSQLKKLDSDYNVTIADHKLRLEFVTIHDAGWYICSQEGYQNHHMAAAKLEVDKSLMNAEFYNQKKNCNAPKFTKYGNMHREILRSTEEKLKLECDAKGIPLPTITWYKDGVTPPQRKVGTVKYTQWAIVLKDLVTTDSGNYTCKVSNENGFIDFTYEVKIINK